jgi:hypothetical protein
MLSDENLVISSMNQSTQQTNGGERKDKVEGPQVLANKNPPKRVKLQAIPSD